MNAKEISPTYFCEELQRFRDLCGNRSFWDGPQEVRDAAFKGITVLYLSTVELTDAEIDGYRWALEDYNKREGYLMRMNRLGRKES
jgi:hypothetical protein